MVSREIEILWILLNLIALLFAAYYDWKLRIILDRIWLVQLLGGIGFLIYYFNTDTLQLNRLLIIINILIGIFFLLVLIFTRILGIGDMKGFFVISISYPLHMTLVQDPLFVYPEFLPSFFAILLNFFFFLLAFGILNFLRNLIVSSRQNLFEEVEGNILQKFSLMIEGVLVKSQNLENWTFYNPGEVYNGENWELFTPNYDSLMDDEQFEKLEAKEKEELVQDINKTDKQYVWIRPQVPGMVFLFLAFLTTITIGTPFGGIFAVITS